MGKPEHHARREGRTDPRRRRLHLHRPKTPSRTAPNTPGGFDVKVAGSDSAAEMYPKARPRLRSQIGEVRGPLLHRISFAEYTMAEEAAVRGGSAHAEVEPSSSKAAAATHDTTNPVSSCFTRDTAAVQAGSSSSWSTKAPPHGTKGLPLPAAAATPPVVPSTQHPTITHADLILRKLRDVPERHKAAAEPDVLVRASYLKTRFAGLIAKATETLSISRRQNLGKRTDDEGSRAAEAAECEMALQREEERSARVDALRKKAREALQEEEKKGRHTGLSRETIHPVHLMELGITSVEHVVSPELRSRDGGALPRRSPLEELGLFVKPVCGDEEIMETK